MRKIRKDNKRFQRCGESYEWCRRHWRECTHKSDTNKCHKVIQMGLPASEAVKIRYADRLKLYKISDKWIKLFLLYVKYGGKRGLMKIIATSQGVTRQYVSYQINKCKGILSQYGVENEPTFKES